MNPEDNIHHDTVIHLKKSHKAVFSVQSPIKFPEEQLEGEALVELAEKHFSGDKEARDELILRHTPVIIWLVGRYLANWPASRPYEDDMFSEGMIAVTELVDKMESPNEVLKLKVKIVVLAKLHIENYLNDMRFPVRASRPTNHRRLKDGKPPEYGASVEYKDQRGNGNLDEGPAFVDLLDSLERLAEVDSEEFVDLVLLAMEQDHKILEKDLTESELEAITKLSKLGANCVS